ncbi:MAG: J domain-containing protein [Chloroflexota bacterium]
MAKRDYYQVLGIGRNASEKEIKQAYRRLARKLHPDVNPGDKAAEERFKEVNRAYEVLSDPEKRKKYDQFGDQWEQADQFAKAGAQQGPAWGFPGGTDTFFEFEGAPGDMGAGDLFEGLFQRFQTGRGRAPRQRRGQDVEQPVEVTLEEAYRGTARLLQVQAQEACPNCAGLGIAQNKTCPMCHGSGAVLRPKRLEVKIPPGVKDGSRIRMAGEGGPGTAGGPKGDLYLVVHVLPHNIFERTEDDLHVKVAVPLLTAVLGGEVDVPTLKGKVSLKIPAETQNERVFRLTGQGMPHLGDSTRGDLFARVSIVLPTNLNQKEKELFQEMKRQRPG